MNNICSTDEDINLSTDISIVQCTEFGLNLEIIKHADSIWMTTQQIAEFYERDVSVIRKHIKNIFDDKILDEKLVKAYFASTYQHGRYENETQTKMVQHYNIDVILEVGLRVTSDKGKKLQNWFNTLGKNTFKQIGEEIQQQDILQLSGEIGQLKQAILNQFDEITLLKAAIIDITTTYRIDEEEKYFLNQLAKERIVELFKVPYNEIDKNQYRIAIAALWRDFKEHFKISKYAMLPRMDLEHAKEYIRYWDAIPYDRFKKQIGLK